MRRPHVVFCHNDLHGGNILYRSEASSVTELKPSPLAVVEEDMAIPGTSSESEEALIERVLKRRAVFPSGRWPITHQRWPHTADPRLLTESTRETRQDTASRSDRCVKLTNGFKYRLCQMETA